MSRLYVPLKKFVPILFLSVFIPLIAVLVIDHFLRLESFFLYILYLFPAFGLLLGILYPFMAKGRDRSEMDWKLPPLVVHISVLASSGMVRMEILDEVSREKEFGPLAREFGNIYRLVSKLNVPLHEACKIVSKDVPSKSFKEFLRRLGHSIEAGEDFAGFIRDERQSVIREYTLLYERSVKSMDATQEFFSGMMAAASFVLVLVAILPPLVGTNPILGICVGILITIILEALVVAILTATLPKDEIWARVRNRGLDSMDLYLLISIGVSIPLLTGLVLITLHGWSFLSLLITVPLAFTPLLLVGLKTRKEENALKRKDDEYPSFVRSTCSSYGYRRGNDAKVIEGLLRQDFGPLSEDIKALHKRLKTGISAKRSWNFFSQDTGSSLIHRFTRILYGGMRSGGDPTELGNTISSTFVTMNGMRKMRYSAASIFAGLVYGLGLAVIAVFALSLGIEEFLGSIYNLEGVSEAMGEMNLQVVRSMGTEIIEVVTLSVVISYAIAGAIVIKLSSSSHPYIIFLHFPLLVWMGSLTATVMLVGVGSLMGV